MIKDEILLREKERYNLPLTISKHEKKLLKKDFPVQKIIGYQIMQNVYIDLKYKVLIPRYETEEVILECYKFIHKNANVLDLGCGSGFIGLAIKKNTNANVTMLDISHQAIKQSKKNAKLNNLNVKILRSNWFSKLNKTNKFDLIVSNPPYLNKNLTYPNSLKYEPKKALFAKKDGFLNYHQILSKAKDFLSSDGHIILEIDPFISKKLKSIYKNIIIKKDINNKERIAILKYSDL